MALRLVVEHAEALRLAAHHAVRDGEGRRLLAFDAAADRGGAEILRLHMREVVAAEIGDRQLAEDVVEDARWRS